MGIYACLADVLEYPDERLAARVDACAAALESNPPAREAVAAFRAAIEPLGLARLQELYASGFDMDADCALYAGHHLFGATMRRGAFMAGLAAEYRSAGMEAAGELPDYVPAILRYMDAAPPSANDVRQELVAEVLLPALRKIGDALDRRQHPYAHAVRAALATLGKETADAAMRPASV